MITMSLRTQICADGTLRLDVPAGLPPGPADIVLVVQPVAPTSAREDGQGVLALHGVWAHKVPDFDLDKELDEIRGRWKEQLEPLP